MSASTSSAVDRPTTFGPYGFPLPQGEVRRQPSCFDEVAPVVVAFVRTYLTGPYVEWFCRKGASQELLVHGNGCSAGGTPFNAGWLDLVSAPCLPLDEGVEDLAKPSPRDHDGYVRLTHCPDNFPDDLKTSLRLVIEHDRLFAAQVSEEIRTYLAIQDALPKEQRDPQEKKNPQLSRLIGLKDMDTCLGWRQDWLGISPAPRPRVPGR